MHVTFRRILPAALLVVAGCAVPSASRSMPGGDPAMRDPTTTAAISTDVAGFRAGTPMMHADAPVFASTDDLAEVSQIGAIGEVAEFADGVLFTEGDPFEFEPVIARLENIELLSGALPAGFDGSLYVALPGYQSAEGYAAAIASGTRMVVYGNDLAGEDTTVRAGAPADQAILNIVHPAGLGLEMRSAAATRSVVPHVRALVFPLAGAVAPHRTADDLAPGNPLPDLDDLARGGGMATE